MWEITVPKTENILREVTLIRWHKNEGDYNGRFNA